MKAIKTGGIIGVTIIGGLCGVLSFLMFAVGINYVWANNRWQEDWVDLLVFGLIAFFGFAIMALGEVYLLNRNKKKADWTEYLTH